ncbi:ABC transporter substrate-binding protein [Actinoplanes sp. OR16]|uniref:ABC transporter substrate-binding protein n=1 Tax=Actinoplanes sp. OR16 TaxID=946334 RepID=UPI000FDC5B82|nr:ABC transporter substrate-binding protein [Actinoplanes sp. OR16]
MSVLVSRRLVLGGGVGAAALLVSGCESAVEQAASGPASSGPVKGGILRIAASADAQPGVILAGRAGNWHWRRLVFETLVELDDKRQPQPLLAKSWTLDDARTTVVLEIRDDVKFHSGRALTAEDVVFSLEQVKVQANVSQVRPVALKLTAIEATGAHQVTLKLDSPTDSLLDLFHFTPIVDKETFATLAEGKTVVGTGPFVWKQWKPGASITLERNPAYRDPERPYLDGVEISIITDPTALLTALRGGTAHLVNGLPTADLKPLRDDKGFALENAGGVFYPLGLNVTAKPFDDKGVRQAVGWALDRERIKAQVFGGDAMVSDLWWTPTEAGYPNDLAGHYKLDAAKAKALVEKAGATGAKVPIVFANLPTMKSLFEIVRYNLEQIGLAPEAVALDTAEFDARQVAGRLGPAFLLLHGMVGFSSSTILDAMPSLRAGNPSQFTTPRYDSLKAKLQTAGDDTKKAALSEISAYLLDESFSHVTMVAPQYYPRSAKLIGAKVMALGSLVATDAYLA